MTERIPDYVEPLEGWRVWRVDRMDDGFRLRSLVQETSWPAREELVAECRKRRLLPRLRRRARHEPPAETCACGIYATRVECVSAYLSQPSWDGAPYVFGRVLLWGTVIECERGWRATRAYPAQLFVPTPRRRGARGVSAQEIADALAAYRVPVVVLPFTPLEAFEALARDLERPAMR